MRVPLLVRIGALVLATTAFYTYVGQMVPQKEVQPPKETALGGDMSTADMVKIGREIMEGKGICLTCHTIGKTGALRFPDLGGIGATAKSRVAGLSDVEYLAQSMSRTHGLCRAGIPSGDAPRQPAADRPHRSGDPLRDRGTPGAWWHADGHAEDHAQVLQRHGRTGGRGSGEGRAAEARSDAPADRRDFQRPGGFAPPASAKVRARLAEAPSARSDRPSPSLAGTLRPAPPGGRR